ncbi:ComF family protein [Halomonas denitrificans]|nr:ComF family protein [Halomonas denitrificans]
MQVDEGRRAAPAIRRGRDAVRALLDTVWPPRCVLCGDLGQPDNLCPGCRAELPRVEHGCRRCANPLPRDVLRCGSCSGSEPAFDATVAALHYQAPVDRLVQRFKFRRDLAAGLALAGTLADTVADRLSSDGTRPQLVVPVPLHWRRQTRRGFNQAELLARDAMHRIAGPPVHELLTRVRSTATQSALRSGRRRANVRAAFRCRRLPPGLAHVALVDDVMTTGATLNECARTLKRAGVARVDAWVVTRA